MHEIVKKGLQNTIEQRVNNLVLELEEDRERTPLNQLLISTLEGHLEIYKELDRLEDLAQSLIKQKGKIDNSSKEFLKLRAVLTGMWINNIMAVRLNCVDEDVLNELIKMDGRMARIEKTVSSVSIY